MTDVSANWPSGLNTDDDEDTICRVCRGPSEPDSPLFHPCYCRGSIKYVHQDCLLQWLKHSRSKRCEVCKQEFVMTPVYADHAPHALSTLEIIVVMFQRSRHLIPRLLRFLTVCVAWGILVPYITASLTKIYVSRSLADIQQAFRGPSSLIDFGTDCVHGLLISCGIVALVVGMSSLREYLHQLGPLEHAIRRAEVDVAALAPNQNIANDPDDTQNTAQDTTHTHDNNTEDNSTTNTPDVVGQDDAATSSTAHAPQQKNDHQNSLANDITTSSSQDNNVNNYIGSEHNNAASESGSEHLAYFVADRDVDDNNAGRIDDDDIGELNVDDAVDGIHDDADIDVDVDDDVDDVDDDDDDDDYDGAKDGSGDDDDDAGDGDAPPSKRRRSGGDDGDDQ
eukprot:c12234_g1_i3.p1 GENE.c12234_g1_i3~~c12234_g1_i3.p1  ORF type:complete len:408 (+),score=118.98 c12234_g1_i3:44-1225(+)